MENLVKKLPKPDELVADLFSDTLATSKPYLDLPGNYCFVGRKVDAEFFAACTEGYVEMYSRPVLNEKLESLNPDEVVDPCKIVARALEELRARKQMRLFKVPTGFSRCRCLHCS